MLKNKTDDYINKESLHFVTVGSVDDGKSTLIGRLLYDSKSIVEDQLMAIWQASEKRGDTNVNLALLTDALSAEQEQGITIDVAYRYFTTQKRKFIISDTPGHIQYTRNMITGASTADLALILIDARRGVVEQTRRHSLIVSMLNIQQIVVCVNKMDLVDYREDIFELIRSNFNNYLSGLDFLNIIFIPICALNGDNVVNPSVKMPWYKGGPLINLLENICISRDENLTDCRFPVQYVLRSNDGFHDYRAYAGRVVGGVFKAGDKVMVLPSKQITQISSIDFYENNVEEAFPPMSVSMRLADDLDVSRGDMIVSEDNIPEISKEFDIMLCWCNVKKLVPGAKYVLMHTTRDVHCIINDLVYIIDVNTRNKIEGIQEVGLNDIARVSIKTLHPLFFDKYKVNRATGSIILIDESTNETVGAGMII